MNYSEKSLNGVAITSSSDFKTQDGREISAEGKLHQRVTTKKELVDENGNVFETSEHIHNGKINTIHNGWGRFYMGYQEAIIKMIEDSKLTFTIFDFILRSANKNNICDLLATKDITETFSKSPQYIRARLRFLADEEFVVKVKGKLMVNPFLVVKPNVSNVDVITAQMLWEDEVGFYGNPDEQTETRKIIMDIVKNAKRKKGKVSVATKQALAIKIEIESYNKTVETP